jgi:hypothetical protein
MNFPLELQVRFFGVIKVVLSKLPESSLSINEMFNIKGAFPDVFLK